MTAHYSKYGLNTYCGTPYFQSQLPQGYPTLDILWKCRANRRLPPNLRELGTLAKRWWAKHKDDEDEDSPDATDIDRYYDADGYELDPDTGKRLTDAEIDADWARYGTPSVAVRDIPVPPGGFADPETWEEPEPKLAEHGSAYQPTRAQLLSDVMGRGKERTEEEYGLVLAPSEDGLSQEDAEALFERRKDVVLNSPYFYELPEGLTGAEEEAYSDARDAERAFLTQTLPSASTYDDLGGAAKAIWDRAEVWATYPADAN